MMTKNEKEKLKKLLPPRWSINVSKEIGLSESYVRRVMSGRASHILIEKKILELAKKYQDEINEVEKLKNTVL